MPENTFLDYRESQTEREKRKLADLERQLLGVGKHSMHVCRTREVKDD